MAPSAFRASVTTTTAAVHGHDRDDADAMNNSTRQTRTNPSRVSKTAARSLSLYGQPNSATEDQPPAPVPHGFYPALTHFTDAITALPREFRRHNSLLKEVDAKAWALEENLNKLLQIALDSEPVPCPPNPAPIIDGVIRDYPGCQESEQSKTRRLLFDRIRRTLSDLMLTADEKNHVISNANDELSHQLFRLDSIFPHIAGEISEEARLGSLTHWAYSNRTATKTTGHERPRREAASHFAHNLEAEHASRSEARREAVLARKQRRNADADFDDARGRKGAGSRGRAAAGDADSVTGAGATKRRRVEKPAAVQTGGTAMERSASGVTSTGRAASKDGVEVKKRSRATNAPATTRKRNNTTASNANSPVSSPMVGTFNPPRSAPSPGPSNRPQSSRAGQAPSSARQRPPSSTSNRTSNNQPGDSKSIPNAPSKKGTPTVDAGRQTETEEESNGAGHLEAAQEDGRADDDASLRTVPNSRGRSSKTSTPVLSTFSEVPSRSRPSRNQSDDAPGSKRSHRKTGSISTATRPRAAAAEDEESSREGDDEYDEAEQRYCYCNEVSFGEMVACDNDACPREWFHLSCVGLSKPPPKNVKWYCNECKESMKRGRAGR